MKAILGIDPGMEGGLALRWPNEVLVELMPTAMGFVDIPSLRNWLAHYSDSIEIALLEVAGMRPGQATQSCFKFARGFGVIEGILSGLRIRYQLIPPKTWSREFEHGVTETADKSLRKRLIKAKRKEIAGRLFPRVDLRETARSRVPHEGMTDALLLAEWGFRQYKKGTL